MSNELFNVLAKHRILLAYDQGKLRYRSPKKSMTNDTKELIQQNKQELLQLLALHNDFVQLGPLSNNQQSLFFAQLQHPKSSAYNLALAVKLNGELDEIRLQTALNTLQNEQPQLSARFSLFESNTSPVPYQIIPEQRQALLTRTDISHISEAQQTAIIQNYYDETIDLATGPIFQTRIYDVSPDTCILILKLHHIVADGWSLKKIVDTLDTLYKDHKLSKVALAQQENSVRSRDYTDYILEQISDEEREEHHNLVEFWQSHLNKYDTAVEFSELNIRPKNRNNQGDTVFFNLPKSTKERVKTLAAQVRTSETAIYFSVFHRLVSEKSQRSDIVIGVPTIGQRGIEDKDIVGYYVNPVPVRCRLAAGLTLNKHAQQCNEAITDTVSHRSLAFTKICGISKSKLDSSRTPLFQVMFNHLTDKVLGNAVNWIYPWPNNEARSFLNLPATPFPIKQQQGQFDCTLEIIEKSNDVLGLLKFDTALFSQTNATQWADDYQFLLEEYLENPEKRLDPLTVPELFNIVITATFTAEPIASPLEKALAMISMKSRISFTPYNQLFQSFIDPNSEFRQNKHGVNIALIRLSDLIVPEYHQEQVNTLISDLVELLENHTSDLGVPLIVHVCESNEFYPHFSISETEAVLEDKLTEISGLILLPQTGFKHWYDPRTKFIPSDNIIGGIPYTQAYYDCLGVALGRYTYTHSSAPLKALIIDCDGTLWDGIVGEDGVANLTIEQHQKAFQNFLLERYKAGIMLCLCSKNNEADVWEVFEKRSSDMILKPEHFSFNRINWLPKSSNIEAIAADMNISVQAMAFLDDSHAERLEVSNGQPSICIVDFPEAWQDRLQYLENFWALDTRAITEADTKRASHYRSESKRKELKHKTTSWQDFIRSLELEITIAEASPSDIERLSQLSYRTNQFNTTLQRLDTVTFSNLISSTKHLILKVNVRDRFGDYGLVGSALCEHDNKQLYVNNFMLSCRALGRTVEYELAKYIGAWSSNHKIDDVTFLFNTGERNQPAKSFLEQLSMATQATTLENDSISIPSNKLRKFDIPDPTQKSLVGTATPIAISSRSTAMWPPALGAIACRLNTPENINQEFHSWPGKLASDASLHSDSELDIQSRVKTIWEHVLETPVNNMEHTFFDLGGNSLLLAQAAILMHQAGIPITLAELFQYPSIAMISKFLASNTATQDTHLTNSYLFKLAPPYQRLQGYRMNKNTP